jgi:diaminohydroxyphosphoribosylaminopyrimidine deaminase/5-amino-6-(5-phosphoribosylamino)uracil reductase
LIACPGADRVELSGVLTVLAEEQIATLFVEGGATVHGTFVDAGLVDRWLIYVAPKVFGGVGALPLALGSGVLNAAEAIQLGPLAVTHLGDDILIESRSADGPAAAFWAERHSGGQGA